MSATEEDIAWFRSTFHPIPRPALPDDCIEYSLYIASPALDPSHDSELRLRLREVQKYATELHRQYLKDYIWQRQGFSLELNKEDGLSFLRGQTEYGDSVEDEWVIVWLLRELTRKFNDLWVKVTDSDGEFLLIEASGTLPSWLEPDVAENRVWIHDGQLKIIKPASASRSSKRTEEKLSLSQARQVILNEPKRLMHSISMEEEAFFRLRNYPAQISANMHHALITIPRKLAYLLHQKPAYIAPAVEAFYLRDPIALKPLQNKDNKARLVFVPEDFVTVSVKFPRVAYAQVKSQEFPAPAVFADAMPSGTDPKAQVRAETGMKVTCGFEMLISDPQYQDRPAVREMKMLLDDLDSGDEVLPSDTEIETWSQQEDDEKWLDISFDDLENELGARKGQTEGKGKKTGFGDKAAQENLQRIVKQFEEFLNDDKAGPDGAGLFGEDSDDDFDDDELDDDEEFEDDEGEDKEASFGEDEFSKMMQEMMGMPPEVMREIMMEELGPGAGGPGAGDPAHRSALRPPATKTGTVRGLDVTDDDDEEESGADLQTFMKQMEAELRGHGALDLGSSSSGTKQRAIQGFTAKTGKLQHDDDGEDEVYELSSEDDDIDNEIDVNLARNLLESLKAQAGKAGPGGNLMGMMGLRMPKDEPGEDDDEDDDNEQAGPSGTQGMTGGTPRIEELE
ncbi:uncharacterized protein Z520_01659 [Fonsecaea multimorphosa CBS 102226]|uniref:Regulatory factor Sgt1 n=1 Tax=Fonsecaea multimorphosa CBS 102226 TaxID=1442371 RepID=A0A0D2J1C8_9EURO|nr:uncharacterized protein Z520_01659 [Fonsecaea multimorphosa CBS 102226]KIY03192.1 hypothetical protein Z520_01659 [Fonsecaea multimorphosa CBS 102226]OAL30434.1 hypothetical protein AYO22_01632 [Fonsecaea multimorphosa]